MVVWPSKVECDSGHSSRGVVNTLGQTSPVSTVTCPPPPRPRPAPPRPQCNNTIIVILQAGRRQEWGRGLLSA